jgi:hypothetical protein
MTYAKILKGRMQAVIFKKSSQLGRRDSTALVTGYHWSHSWPQSQVAFLVLTSLGLLRFDLGLLWIDLAYSVVLEITEARLLEVIALGLRCFGLFESDMV